MLTVRFYAFAKRRNSIAVPDEKADLRFTFKCLLKEASSIIHPVIELAPEGDFAAPGSGLNYAWIEEFHRYYYVTDWASDRGRWVASMTVDALASWWPDYKAQQFYCLRCGNPLYRSSYAVDSMIPATTKVKTINQTSTGSLGYSLVPDQICYVVGIVSTESGGIGPTKYYAFYQSQFRKFLDYLFQNVDWMQIDGAEISASLQKAILNPLQYITSCTMFPFPPADFSLVETGSVSPRPLKIGWWSIPGMSYYTIKDFTTEKHCSIPIPHTTFPAEDLNPPRYLDGAPYTEMQLFVPGFGSLPLNPNLLLDETTLELMITIDAITGRCSLESVINALLPGRIYGQIGVPIKLGQFTQDLIGAAKGITQATVGTAAAALSLDFGGAISNALSGVESAIKAATPSYTSIGSDGSLLDITTRPYIESYSYELVQSSPDIGVAVCRPLAPKDPQTDGGYSDTYMLFSNAHVSISGTPEESDMIESALNGGIYV